MNQLTIIARKTLFNKENIGLRLPKFLGVMIGYIADVVSQVIAKNLPISSIRVKKFMSTTQFSSSINQTDFNSPVKLEDGLIKTLKYEFIDDNSNKRTFKTE